MTALCGGGASRPKPGVNEVIIFTSSQLGSFLNNKGGLWATIAVGALGVLTYEATSLCADDPPPTPTLTASDYRALLNLEPFDEFTAALGKLRDLITIALWYDLCECSASVTPPPATGLLTPPAGVSVPDYGLTPCAQPRLRITVRAPTVIYADANNLTREAFPNLPTTISVSNGSDRPSQTIAELPATWSSVYSQLQLVSGTTPPTQGYAVGVTTYNADRTVARSITTTVVTTAAPTNRDPPTGAVALLPSERYFSINDLTGTSLTQTGVVDWALNVTCTGSSVANPGCCSDPVLYSLVNSLLQQVQLVRRDTETLQRYGLPFAYIAGATHTNLSGTGSLNIGRSVGLRIDVVTFPSGNQQMLGQPPYIFDLGWVSVLTPDGLLDEIRLTRQSTSWMSKLIPTATRLGWGLRDGVVVNVTELGPEQ